MNISQNHRAWLSLILGVGTASSAWAVRQTEVDVFSNLTIAGDHVKHPDPAHPIYYLPILSGFTEPAQTVAFGEKPPPTADVGHEVAVALSHEGYLQARPGLRVNADLEIAYADGTVVTVPANPPLDQRIYLNQPGDVPLTVAMIESPDGPYSFHRAHRTGPHHTLSPLIQTFRTIDRVHGPVMQAMPALVIVISWGDLHAGGGSGAPEPLDLPVWIAILAGNSFGGPGLVNLDPRSISNHDRDEIIQRMTSDRYFVVVSAFDFQSCLGGRQKKLLWRTRMSVPSNLPGETFAEMLPLLLKAGESKLGRDTKHPEYSVVPLAREGTVSIGALEVKDYEEVPQTIPDTGRDKFLPLKFEPNP